MTLLTAFLGDRMLAISPWEWGAVGVIAISIGLALHLAGRRRPA